MIYDCDIFKIFNFIYVLNLFRYEIGSFAIKITLICKSDLCNSVTFKDGFLYQNNPKNLDLAKKKCVSGNSLKNLARVGTHFFYLFFF